METADFGSFSEKSSPQALSLTASYQRLGLGLIFISLRTVNNSLEVDGVPVVKVVLKTKDTRDNGSGATRFWQCCLVPSATGSAIV